MSNPFHDSLDTFRGRRVRVVSNDGRIREGWLERMDYRDRHVVLRDARDPTTDEALGRAFVSHVDTMDIVEDVDRRVERVPLDAIDPSPLHVREFDIDSNQGYIRQVRDQGWVGSYPTVRELRPRQFECVHGHKRLWVAEQACLDEHPVVIVDINELEAAQRYVIDHHPGLTADQRKTVVKRLVSRFGEQNLPRFPLVGTDATADESENGSSEETAGGGHADESPPEGRGDESQARGGGHDAGDEDVQVESGVEDIELSPPQENALDVLADHGGGMPMPDLKEATGVGASVYGTVSALVDAGVAQKRTDPDDQRRKLVELTADGAARVGITVDADQEDKSDDQDAGDQKDIDEESESDEDVDGDADQEDIDEGQVADATEEIDAAATNGGLTVADIDWLDESSFHVAVTESGDLEELRETLGWLDEDGDLAALVRGMDATDDLPDFQEGNA